MKMMKYIIAELLQLLIGVGYILYTLCMPIVMLGITLLYLIPGTRRRLHRIFKIH